MSSSPAPFLSAPRKWLPAVVCILLLLLAPAPALASPEQDLQEGARAYERSDFKQAIELIRPLLYPTIRLSQQDQVLQAHKLLGISHVFEKNRTEAAKEFLAILSIRPTYRLDPLVDPASAVRQFEEVKKRNADKIRQILDRERREAVRHRLAEERRRAEDRRLRLLAGQANLVIERTVVEHPYWINFVPLAGQFQNGHRTKGFVLLGTQVGLAALSLGSGLGVYWGYTGRALTREEYDRARALSIVQVASAGLCAAAVAYGIIDALYYHRSRTVSERRYWRKSQKRPAKSTGATKKTSLFVVPSLGADGTSGGLGLGFTF